MLIAAVLGGGVSMPGGDEYTRIMYQEPMLEQTIFPRRSLTFADLFTFAFRALRFPSPGPTSTPASTPPSAPRAQSRRLRGKWSHIGAADITKSARKLLAGLKQTSWRATSLSNIRPFRAAFYPAHLASCCPCHEQAR